MTTWTPAARAEWDRYVARSGPDLAAAGADPLEVLEDLRRHVEVEAAREGVQTLTAEDVRRLIARLGPVAADPESVAAPVSPPLPEAASARLVAGPAGGVVTGTDVDH